MAAFGKAALSNPAEKNLIIEVAAAILLRSDNTFLLAQRPLDKIMGGYWEFPGGKIEKDEVPYHALEREVGEELGVTIVTAYPWITRIFTYSHATVRLYFFRVTAWTGMLHPHEGQKFSWQCIREVKAAPVLPANALILRALELPPLYGISNVAELGEHDFICRLETSLKKGLRLVQLREKNYTYEALRGLAIKILPLVRQYGARLIINRDIALAREVGADGVQLSGEQLSELNKRPDVDWCGASCHNAAELRRAEELGCDFAVMSPVLATKSHPRAAYLGWKRFADNTSGTSIPVYALGGLTHGDIEIAWEHGAHGIALLRQAW